MVDVRWCACIHGNSPNLDQHQNGFDLVFVRFCRILSCQNLEEQLLASPARCSLKTGSSQCVLRYSKGPTIIHQPRSGDILPIVRCGSFETIVDLDDFDALSRLLFFQSLQDLPITIMLVTGNDTNWQCDRIWQFQMLQAFNNDQKCPFPVLNKLQEDPRKNKIAHTNDFTSSDDIVLSETNWFVRPHWVWQNFWHLFWYLFWRYFLKLPDIESDVTSDIWSDIAP